MKPEEIKRQFIQLRAEGKSYSAICAELHISKSTCTSWERELKQKIDEQKQAELTELCESYGITKEARIRKLGETLNKIDAAISTADFSKVDAAKLLDFKLKYTEALKEEYTGAAPSIQTDSIDAQQIIAALGDLLNRARTGDITTEQAQKESNIISHLLKAYDTVEVKAKLAELEAIIGGRQ